MLDWNSTWVCGTGGILGAHPMAESFLRVHEEQLCMPSRPGPEGPKEDGP